MDSENKRSPGSIIINLFFCLLTLAMLIPFVLVVSISLTNEQTLFREGYQFFPSNIDFTAYKIIFGDPGVLFRAYGVTIVVTVVGTFLSLLLTTMMGYVISRRDYRYNRITTFYVFFTMLFGGGLVPSYILITQYLHMRDTIWAMIIPAILSPFNIMLMKGFLSRMPPEIIESAKIDGAGEFRIFFRMIIPLSVPALATLGVLASFAFWNDWWLGLLYIESQSLVPLQLLLYRMMSQMEFLKSLIEFTSIRIDTKDFPTLSSRMAMAVLAAGPMMFVFPFFQRFFVSGLTVGSLKG